MTSGQLKLYGRPSSAAAALRAAVHQLLLEHDGDGDLPTSNRFLFYELVQRGILDKTKPRQTGRGADQNLSDASKWLRDEGLVPWGWIVDETRSLTEWEYADSVSTFVAESVDRARIDCWANQPPPLIVCESRTFGGVLRRGLAADYLCPVTATNGQVGGFLHTNVVPILRGGERRVLYIGDLDLAGDMIEANTQRVLVREAGAREWRRIALTAGQRSPHLVALVVLASAHVRERLGDELVERGADDRRDHPLAEGLDLDRLVAAGWSVAAV